MTDHIADLNERPRGLAGALQRHEQRAADQPAPSLTPAQERARAKGVFEHYADGSSRQVGWTEERVVFPRPRGDFDDCDCTTPPPIDEPTGQHAVVVNQAGDVFVRLEHRWYQAGGATVDPILWSEIHAVRVVSRGES